MDAGSGGSIDLGDTAAAEQVYKDALTGFNRFSASSPLFLLPGNHEQQEAWHLISPLASSLPIMGKNAEKKYFLNPVPSAFYSANPRTIAELTGDHLVQDYYSWKWGDALFVVISPYWTTTTKPYTTLVGGGEGDTTGSGDRWDWTLGEDQFEWLESTLANSDAKYKFVFSHQITGSNGMTSPDMVNYGHGGLNAANFAEWGGYNTDGTTWAWDTERPGWGSLPIRQMMEANGATAFFHGHDHQMAYETLNGMVYQSVPAGSFSGSFDDYATGDTHTLGASTGQTVWADSSQGAGRLKVTVGSDEATVDFIRYNQSTPAYSYTMAPRAPSSVAPAGMPSSATAAANATSVSFSHTTGTGDDGLLLAGVSWNCGTTDRSIVSATFTPTAGSPIALTEVVTQQGANSSGNPRYSAIYSLLNPPKNVTGTVTVTFSGAVGNGIVAGAASFEGVDQADPFEAAAGDSLTSGQTPTVSFTGLDGDELVFDNVFQGGSSDAQTLSNGPGQTGLWNAFSSNTRAAASTKQASDSSVTMSWTANSAAVWAIVAVPINPAPTSPAVDISGATIAPIPSQTYTGSAITPAVTVTLGSDTLVKDTDYTVAYASNTNAGTATVTLTGIGDYTGTKNANFTIAKATPSVITWPTASSITLGQALSASTLAGGVHSVLGSFTFAAPTTVPLVTGPYAAAVTFNPTDCGQLQLGRWHGPGAGQSGAGRTDQPLVGHRRPDIEPDLHRFGDQALGHGHRGGQDPCRGHRLQGRLREEHLRGRRDGDHHRHRALRRHQGRDVQDRAEEVGHLQAQGGKPEGHRELEEALGSERLPSRLLEEQDQGLQVRIQDLEVDQDRLQAQARRALLRQGPRLQDHRRYALLREVEHDQEREGEVGDTRAPDQVPSARAGRGDECWASNGGVLWAVRSEADVRAWKTRLLGHAIGGRRLRRR